MADKINAAGYETKPWWPYVRALMEGGGSVTVEQLNVTENGTYTAEAGKAYSPVVVNVPQTQLSSLSVTENGTYTPEEGNAYNSVTVNVEGGSSDFSTAEVTFINNSNSTCEFELICVIDDLTNKFGVTPNQTKVANVVFYQDDTEMTGYLSNVAGGTVTLSFTGDIVDDGDGYFLVSGAGTVTITNAQ